MKPDGLASRAEVILDPRLIEVWRLVWSLAEQDEDFGALPTEILAGLLRLAYLQGFADAKDEPMEGELYRALGIRTPVTPRSARRRPAPRRRPHRNSGN